MGGLQAAMEYGLLISGGVENYIRKIRILKDRIDNCDAIFIGAGGGISNAAGKDDKTRFRKFFPDFIDKYHVEDIFSGGYYPFETSGEYWAWWSRAIWEYRYEDRTNELYEKLLKILDGKNYFIMTTNVDHEFVKNGFDKERLFYMDGDYGTFRCSEPCKEITYDNLDMVIEMMKAQGFVLDEDGRMNVPPDGRISMDVPKDLQPKCPECGRPMAVNISGRKFVYDNGWFVGEAQKNDFLLNNRSSHILCLELGAGIYTKDRIRHPLWDIVMQNMNATYAAVNFGETSCPEYIKDRSILIDADIKNVINDLVGIG